MNYEVDEENRRPLKSRSWPLADGLSSGLVRLGVTANAVSVVGMLIGIAAGVLFTRTPNHASFFYLAAFAVQMRLLCNLLDGMVAVKSETASRVGELFNEIPDRIADSAILVGFGFALNSEPLLGALATAAAIFVAYVRAFGASLDLGQDFCGPFAKPHRMFTITLAAIICGINPDLAIAGMAFPVFALWLLIAGSLFTAARRIFRMQGKLKPRV
ncbi:MAG: phosphatidylglycerophosphate synthase [Kiritimatiellia bacterium]|jgi:phosphatidylglycerophosphate synthase